MNGNTAFKLQSVAQFFCITFISLSALMLPTSSEAAECSKSDEALLSKCYDDNGKAKTSSRCQQVIRNCGSSSLSSNTNASADSCASAKQSANQALNEFRRSCGEAGLGGASCSSQMSKCQEIGEASEYSDNEDVLKAFSQALGVQQSQVSSQCPKYSGQGYFERKDKYEGELDDVNDKLGDIKTELADLEKELNEQTQDIQEDIADAQKEYDELATKTKEDKRNRATERASKVSDLNRQMREQRSTILSKQQEITNIYRSKNQSLISLSKSERQSSCLKTVKELKKSYETIAGGSTKNLIKKASEKKKALQEKYDNCMAQLEEQKAGLIEQAEQKIQSAQDTINKAQSEIDDMTQQLSSLETQEAETQKDENEALTKAQQALSQKITRATTKIQSLQQTATKKTQTLQEKQAYYQKKSTSVSNAITALGAVPADETSNTKLSVVQGNWDSYQDAMAEANSIEGCSFSDATSSKSKRSTTRSSGSSSGKK